MNKNKNSTSQNLWDRAKPVLKEKYISLNSYIRKEESSQIHNLSFQLTKLKQNRKLNPKQVKEG